ncbi:ABC transporter permease subunit [Glaciecola sp. XM2]|jgi:ABC-2 type transport system permease protein|uniref:ABC transporter permease subunit n=1 Tax=Glaciecola sp. XM2 TaxID=1914931 RepID=UPI001BDDEEA3|nr:ABC transporter permease subunit [Glaciecola sp. XM2]MBT1452352.1 ABC transporter permease subunit [Glaciecola sp. XM2]
MNASIVVFKREFLSFFSTPVAYIFIGIFLSLSGVFTFIFGGFYEREQADLLPFFNYHPWLYLFLVPAISMRIWSEERKSGTIELLMTLPLSTFQIIIGKFLAAWLVLGVCLLLTMPLWLTVNYLGSPDNGLILASYIGSWLMAGSFLSLGMCMSATTRNQVVAFILTVVISFLFILTGTDVITALLQGSLPNWALDTVASLSFLTHFQEMAKGVIRLNNLVFFVAMIMICLFANYVIILKKKAA